MKYVKYSLVGIVLASTQVFAGGGQSTTRGGMVPRQDFLHIPKSSYYEPPLMALPSGMRIVTGEIIQALAQPIPPPPVVAIPPPIDYSAQAAQDIIDAYTQFLSIQSQSITNSDVTHFAGCVSSPLIRYPQIYSLGRSTAPRAPSE